MKNTYKKIGGGSLTLSVDRNKPLEVHKNDVFEAFEWEIPQGFQDVVVLIKDNSKVEEEIKEVETEKIEEVVPTEEPEPIEEVETEDKPAYRLEPHAAGYFKIIATYSDGTTKKMLKSKKRRKDAEKILEELLA